MAAKCMKIKITAIIGTAAIKANPLPDATYYAVIEFTLVSGKKGPLKTDLTIYVDRSHFYISSPPCLGLFYI